MLPVLLYPMLIPLLIGAMGSDHGAVQRRIRESATTGASLRLLIVFDVIYTALRSVPDRVYSDSLRSHLCVKKLIYALGLLGTLLMIYNLHTIFVDLPDEALQGAIYRIIFIHVPAAIDRVHLLRRGARHQRRAFWPRRISCTIRSRSPASKWRPGFTLVNLVTGSIWGRNHWGIWWTWDLRLTSQLMCFVLYLGYLLMPAGHRRAHAARHHVGHSSPSSPIADMPLVMMAIRLPNVRTQHPEPGARNGEMDPSFIGPVRHGHAGAAVFGTALVLIRLHQETSRREIDSLRRELHAV